MPRSRRAKKFLGALPVPKRYVPLLMKALTALMQPHDQITQKQSESSLRVLMSSAFSSNEPGGLGGNRPTDRPTGFQGIPNAGSVGDVRPQIGGSQAGSSGGS